MEKYKALSETAINALKDDLAELLKRSDKDFCMLVNDYIVSGTYGTCDGILLYDLGDFDMFVKDQFEWSASELINHLGNFKLTDKWFYFDESGEKIHSIQDGAKWYRERITVEELVKYVLNQIDGHFEHGYGLDFDFGYTKEFSDITSLLVKWHI